MSVMEPSLEFLPFSAHTQTHTCNTHVLGCVSQVLGYNSCERCHSYAFVLLYWLPLCPTDTTTSTVNWNTSSLHIILPYIIFLTFQFTLYVNWNTSRSHCTSGLYHACASLETTASCIAPGHLPLSWPPPLHVLVALPPIPQRTDGPILLSDLWCNGEECLFLFILSIRYFQSNIAWLAKVSEAWVKMCLLIFMYHPLFLPGSRTESIEICTWGKGKQPRYLK